MCEKLSFNFWIKCFENFGSMSNFKKYINDNGPTEVIREELHQYYREKYMFWYHEQID